MDQETKTAAEHQELMDYGRQRTRENFDRIMATPKAAKHDAYAWRNAQGEIVIQAHWGAKPPAVPIFGKAEGQNLRTPIWMYYGGCGPEHFLTPEEQTIASRRIAEIKTRNICELRSLRQRARQDLLKKEKMARDGF